MSVASHTGWDVSEEEFPLIARDEDRIRFLLNYAVLAPSGHNTQPWRFRVVGEAVELHADRSRRLPEADPGDRELVISCGAALLHLKLAMRYFGYEGRVRALPDRADPDLLAVVELGGRYAPTSAEAMMFRAIRRRHTWRAEFADAPVPAGVVAALRQAAAGEGARLLVAAERPQKEIVADLIAEADRALWSDGRYRGELADWCRSNISFRRDGLPGYALGEGALASLVAGVFVRCVDMGGPRGEADRRLAEDAPVLAVLETDGDRPEDWLAAGEALAAVLLRAAAEGVSAGFFSGPLEFERLRPAVRDAVGGTGYAQMLLRLGFAPGEVRPTPRRTIEDVSAVPAAAVAPGLFVLPGVF